jgi:hypothetical protein
MWRLICEKLNQKHNKLRKATSFYTSVFKKGPNFLNNRPTSTDGALFKKFGLFFEHVEIQENAITELRALTESAFQEAFQQWKKRWKLCIASRGDYFEGDSA